MRHCECSSTALDKKLISIFYQLAFKNVLNHKTIQKQTSRICSQRWNGEERNTAKCWEQGKHAGATNYRNKANLYHFRIIQTKTLNKKPVKHCK